jgi:hypothetical protein
MNSAVYVGSCVRNMVVVYMGSSLKEAVLS